MYGIIFVLIILILLIITGIRTSKEESAKVASFIRDSFCKASRRKLTETRRDSLRKNLEMFLEGKKEGDIVYVRPPKTQMTDATKIMSRNENQSKREFGKPKRHHLLLQMNAGFAGVKTFEGTTAPQ